MAIVINGSGTVTGISVGGLPDDIVDSGTLASDALDSAVTISDTGADVDFRVESDGNANMLFVDGGNNRVGIGTNAPARQFHLKDSSTYCGLAIDGNASANAAGVMFYHNGTEKAGMLWDNAANSLEIYGQVSNDTDMLRLTSDGRGLSQFTAKAWCNFDGTGTPAFRDSHNCSSLTDIGTGNWVVVYTNAIGASNCIVGQCKASAYLCSIGIPAAANSDTIRAVHNDGTVMDVDYAAIAVFGD